MTKYLVLSPDRYARFGHQTSSLSTGLLLACITGTKVIWPRYMYSCDKWNKYIDFSKSKFVTREISGQNIVASFIENQISDNAGNRKWNLSHSHELSQLVARITALNDNTMAFLPFDQTPGILHRLYNQKEIRQDIQRAFSSCSISTNTLEPYVAIHVRRGDVTEYAHPSWYVSNEFYISLIEDLDRVLPPTFGIYICTQGNTSWLAGIHSKVKSNGRRFRISSASDDFTNDSEVEDFIAMKEATILFSASSGFSHWATIAGNQKLVIDVARNHGNSLGWVKNLNPDFSTHSIIGHIASLTSD